MTKALSIEEAALKAQKEIRPMRDGEVAPVTTDEATATANEASVAVPHSPLPWRIEDCDIVEPGDSFVACVGLSDDRDAAFIVTACNSHHALLEALKEMVAAIEDSTEDADDVLSMLRYGKAVDGMRAAINAAEGSK